MKTGQPPLSSPVSQSVSLHYYVVKSLQPVCILPPPLTKFLICLFKRRPSLAHHVYLKHLLWLYMLLKCHQRFQVAALCHAIMKGKYYFLFFLCRQSSVPCQSNEEAGRALNPCDTVQAYGLADGYAVGGKSCGKI